MANLPQRFPFTLAAGGTLSARLDTRCWSVIVSNFTAQYLEILDANDFVPPNTRQILSLPGVLVGQASFAAPGGIAQPVAISGQKAYLTYTEQVLPPSGGVVGATAIASVVTLQRFTKALLPAAGAIGSLVLLTDYDRGVWKDTGKSFVSLEGERFNVKQFGAIGDGVVDDTVAIQAAMSAAAATATNGSDVVFPLGRYKVTSPLVASTGVRLIGYGSSNRWGQNTTIYPVRIEYAGATAALALQPAAGAHLRNFKVDNIHFDGTNSNGAVDGLLFDATSAGSDIQGCVFEDCLWSNFPRSQIRQPAAGAGSSMWGLTFTRCSTHDRDRATTGNSVDFAGPGIQVAELTFDDCILAPFTAGEWSAKILAADTRFLGGTCVLSHASSHGLWLATGSTTVGMHIEGLGGATTSIGARLTGNGGHIFFPAFLGTCQVGVQIGDPTSKATAVAGVTLGGNINGNILRDIHIIDGGSRANTLILPVGAAPVFLDDHAGIDGVYSVTRLDSQKIVSPPGTAAAPAITFPIFAGTGLWIDAATGDLVFSMAGVEGFRWTAANRFQSKRQIWPGSGVNDNTAQSAAGILGGTGVPTNAVGNDGDVYIRSDGGAGTTIYQRRVGVWVATAA